MLLKSSYSMIGTQGLLGKWGTHSVNANSGLITAGFFTHHAGRDLDAYS